MSLIWQPFGTQDATNCLPEGCPKIDQKTGAKKHENGARMEGGFHPGGPPKSLKIEPWPKMVPQGGPSGAPSLKKPPRSCQQAPKSDKKRCKMLTPIIIPPPSHLLNANRHDGVTALQQDSHEPPVGAGGRGEALRSAAPRQRLQGVLNCW